MLIVTQGDITLFNVDAIVNAASTHLHRGGGVGGAIHRAAGPALLTACRTYIRQHGRIRTGDAVLTPAGHLPCRYVIHTVGPHWLFGLRARHQDKLLAKAYYQALVLARENVLQRIAFPCISTGHYFYPHERAARIAINTIIDFLAENGADMDVLCVCYNKRDFRIYQRLLAQAHKPGLVMSPPEIRRPMDM